MNFKTASFTYINLLKCHIGYGWNLCMLTKILSGLQFSKEFFWNFASLRLLLAVKGPFGGVGAPTPNFDLSSNSYNNIFSLTAQKLHFLYSAKLVGYDYVWFFCQKVPPHLFRGRKTLVFWRYGARHNIYHIFVMIFISRIYGMKTKYKNRRKYQYKHFMGLNAKNLAVSNNFPMDQANLDIIFVKISLN